jgi:hypothetical protein
MKIVFVGLNVLVMEVFASKNLRQESLDLICLFIFVYLTLFLLSFICTFIQSLINLFIHSFRVSFVYLFTSPYLFVYY